MGRNQRRHLSGLEVGSGAGAPRSLHDQLERRDASRRQTRKIVEAAIERVLAERDSTRSVVQSGSDELVDPNEPTPWDRNRMAANTDTGAIIIPPELEDKGILSPEQSAATRRAFDEAFGGDNA